MLSNTSFLCVLCLIFQSLRFPVFDNFSLQLGKQAEDNPDTASFDPYIFLPSFLHISPSQFLFSVTLRIEKGIEKHSSTPHTHTLLVIVEGDTTLTAIWMKYIEVEEDGMYCVHRRPHSLSLERGLGARSPANLDSLIMKTKSYFEDEAPFDGGYEAPENTPGLPFFFKGRLF